MEKNRQQQGKMATGKTQSPVGGVKQQTGSEKTEPGKAQQQGSSPVDPQHPILGKETESREGEAQERERLRIQQERFQEEGVKKDKPAA